jgi:hypothetical protein
MRVFAALEMFLKKKETNIVMNESIFISYFTFLFFIFFSCTSSGGGEKQLDTWLNRTCCNSNEEKNLLVELFEMNAPSGLTISFCEDSQYRIVLYKKKNDSYELIFDLRSNENLNIKNNHLGNGIPEGFDGEYQAMDRNLEGNYRFFISSNMGCGEISFQVNNEELVNTNFLCLSQCN